MTSIPAPPSYDEITAAPTIAASQGPFKSSNLNSIHPSVDPEAASDSDDPSPAIPPNAKHYTRKAYLRSVYEFRKHMRLVYGMLFLSLIFLIPNLAQIIRPLLGLRHGWTTALAPVQDAIWCTMDVLFIICINIQGVLAITDIISYPDRTAMPWWMAIAAFVGCSGLIVDAFLILLLLLYLLILLGKLASYLTWCQEMKDDTLQSLPS
ncbi:hypothetical protein HK104_008556 [Borealophlyctis nickersoniae]|nr:hypothetical protein HK104_008556 [Borealophlyctis nickersoniae]